METISLFRLAFAFIPVLITLLILWKWSLGAGNALYAVLRMLAQLLLIGYVLNYMFTSNSAWLILGIVLVMMLISSWISLSVVKTQRRTLYLYTAIAILVGGGSSLALMTQIVLGLSPWYKAQVLIPLAGMVFANCMNSVSLAAERLYSELARGALYRVARSSAMNTAMIPMINSLFAVGLVSLPGMMTGQILSGVEPLIAARYQIMVMCMIFGSGGIAAAIFLILLERLQLSTASEVERTPN